MSMNEPHEPRRAVLIVEADAVERERLGDICESLGYDVTVCFGPTGPDYTCVGEREGQCPLVDAADLVILDTWLDSDTASMGTPASELLTLYHANGLPVLTLGAPRGAVDVFGEEPVVHLSRMPSTDQLTDALALLAQASAR